MKTSWEQWHCGQGKTICLNFVTGRGRSIQGSTAVRPRGSPAGTMAQRPRENEMFELCDRPGTVDPGLHRRPPPRVTRRFVRSCS